MANGNFTINAASLFAEEKGYSTDTLTEVPGLGDDAFWVGAVNPDGDRYISLEVLRRGGAADVYFSLHMMPRAERIYTEIEALAAAAVGRLP